MAVWMAVQTGVVKAYSMVEMMAALMAMLKAAMTVAR